MSTAKIVTTLPPHPTFRSATGLADLAILLGSFPIEVAQHTASLLGYERVPPEPPRQESIEVTPTVVDSGPKPLSQSAPQPQDQEAGFWVATHLEWTDPKDQPSFTQVVPQGLTEAEIRGADRSLHNIPDTQPLCPWSRLWPPLQKALRQGEQGSRLDIPVLVRKLGRAEMVPKLPRQKRSGWGSRLHVWVDRSRRLVPFWQDQERLCERLQRVIGKDRLRVTSLSDVDITVHLYHTGTVAPVFSSPNALRRGARLLVVSDLGAYGSPQEQLGWLHTGAQLNGFVEKAVALVPCPRSRWSPAAANPFQSISWEFPGGGAPVESQQGAPTPELLEQRAQPLLQLAALAAWIPPGLLRAMRLLLPTATADVGTEVDLWNHPTMNNQSSVAACLSPEAAQILRETAAKEISVDIQERLAHVFNDWHGTLPKELLHLETLVWKRFGLNKTPGSVAMATEFFERAVLTGVQGDFGEDVAREIAAVTRVALRELAPDKEVYSDPGIGTTVQKMWALAHGKNNEPLPEGVDPTHVRGTLDPNPDKPRWWGLRQVGNQLHIQPLDARWDDRQGTPGSPVAWWMAGSRWIDWGIEQAGRTVFRSEELPKQGGAMLLPLRQNLLLKSDTCPSLRLSYLKRSAMGPMGPNVGRDRFGLWSEYDLDGIKLKFRWIPPGRFWMGSPHSKAGRDDDEGPRHEVILTDGFWLADTPCTQAVWKWVYKEKENPSRFQSDDRPVEQVSWGDCKKFIEALNQKIPGLNARLPTEAQWEYACRGGTTTATWVGDLDIQGEHNAPILDNIAWYGGNSGDGFELANGYDPRGWTDKAYPRNRAGTRPVATKYPNPFGLYDMLGNVWEWCEDWYGPYHGDQVPNPVGPQGGSDRVVRGGSWYNQARDVRAALRLWYGPGNRYDYLGFRLARDHQD